MTSPFRAFSALLLSSFAAVAQSPAPPPNVLRIGTWNLEFLGAEGDYRDHLPLRTDADFAAIGKKVHDLGVALLAVQEACGEAPVKKVAAAAGPSWQCVVGTSGGWDDGKTFQSIGFLYDTSVLELLQAEELLQFPRELEGVPIFHRVPLTACFRVKATGFDFRAITVHLKAGRAAKDEQKRRLEATTLHEWLAGLQKDAGEDQDIVLLGDFNCTYGAEPETILEQGGGLQYSAMPTRPPTILHFADPIDQIVVGRGLDEAKAATFTVHGDLGGLERDAWRKTYSDHFPVTIDLDAARDADPQATFAHGPMSQSLPVTLRPKTKGTRPAVGASVYVVVQGGETLRGVLVEPVPATAIGYLTLDSGVMTLIPLDKVLRIEW